MDRSIEFLPPRRRIAYYRGMAAEVRRLSEKVQFEEARLQFVALAAAWDGLADDLELKENGASRGPRNPPAAESIAS
ncbi:MAG TPA: hypothetical protein VGL35_12020 [Rhizomicrobium sp.]|jgi:hypothetical protein